MPNFHFMYEWVIYLFENFFSYRSYCCCCCFLMSIFELYLCAKKFDCKLFLVPGFFFGIVGVVGAVYTRRASIQSLSFYLNLLVPYILYFYGLSLDLISNSLSLSPRFLLCKNLSPSPSSAIFLLLSRATDRILFRLLSTGSPYSLTSCLIHNSR